MHAEAKVEEPCSLERNWGAGSRGEERVKHTNSTGQVSTIITVIISVIIIIFIIVIIITFTTVPLLLLPLFHPNSLIRTNNSARNQ